MYTHVGVQDKIKSIVYHPTQELTNLQIILSSKKSTSPYTRSLHFLKKSQQFLQNLHKETSEKFLGKYIFAIWSISLQNYFAKFHSFLIRQLAVLYRPGSHSMSMLLLYSASVFYCTTCTKRSQYDGGLQLIQALNFALEGAQQFSPGKGHLNFAKGITAKAQGTHGNCCGCVPWVNSRPANLCVWFMYEIAVIIYMYIYTCM